jgi:hypothetical protein
VVALTSLQRRSARTRGARRRGCCRGEVDQLRGEHGGFGEHRRGRTVLFVSAGIVLGSNVERVVHGGEQLCTPGSIWASGPGLRHRSAAAARDQVVEDAFAIEQLFAAGEVFDSSVRGDAGGDAGRASRGGRLRGGRGRVKRHATAPNGAAGTLCHWATAAAARCVSRPAQMHPAASARCEECRLVGAAALAVVAAAAAAHVVPGRARRRAAAAWSTVVARPAVAAAVGAAPVVAAERHPPHHRGLIGRSSGRPVPRGSPADRRCWGGTPPTRPRRSPARARRPPASRRSRGRGWSAWSHQAGSGSDHLHWR